MAVPVEAARRTRPDPSWRRPSPWAWLVLASASILVAAGLVLAILYLTSRESRTATYDVPGPLVRVELDVGHGDVELVGGARAGVRVRRTERFAYGHGPAERRSLRHGVLRIDSTCPDVVVGFCNASYRVALPDNVLVRLHVADGDVRITAINSSVDVTTGAGSINMEAWCGHTLDAVTTSGAVRASADCIPEVMNARTDSGDVSLTVPAGGYRVVAHSAEGKVTVTGVADVDSSDWSLQALSNTGDVRVEGEGS